MTKQFDYTHLLGALAAIAGAVNSLGLLLGGAQNIYVRWVIWTLAIIFFGLAFFLLKEKDAEVVIVGQGDKRHTIPNGWRPLYISGFFVSIVVLVADIWLVNVREPIIYYSIDELDGNMAGIIHVSAEKHLHELRNNAQVALRSEVEELHRTGVIGDTVIARKFSDVILHDYYIEVVRYDEMPEFYPAEGAGGVAQQIEITFAIENKGDVKFPWIFEPVAATYTNNNGESRDLSAPFVTDGFAPVQVRYFINSFDTGIYWVRIGIVVSEGIGVKRRILLTKKPIPIAFYDSRNQDQLNDESREKLRNRIKEGEFIGYGGMTTKDFVKYALSLSASKKIPPAPKATEVSPKVKASSKN